MSQLAKQPRKGFYPMRVAVKVAGVSVRNVDYWARIGLATPKIEAAGAGSDRWYTFNNLVVLAAVAQLQPTANIALRRLLVAEIRRNPSAQFVSVKVGPLVELVCNIERLRVDVRRSVGP